VSWDIESHCQDNNQGEVNPVVLPVWYSWHFGEMGAETEL
jgi:hypothetical protein